MTIEHVCPAFVSSLVHCIELEGCFRRAERLSTRTSTMYAGAILYCLFHKVSINMSEYDCTACEWMVEVLKIYLWYADMSRMRNCSACPH